MPAPFCEHAVWWPHSHPSVIATLEPEFLSVVSSMAFVAVAFDWWGRRPHVATCVATVGIGSALYHLNLRDAPLRLGAKAFDEMGMVGTVLALGFETRPSPRLTTMGIAWAYAMMCIEVLVAHDASHERSLAFETGFALGVVALVLRLRCDQDEARRWRRLVLVLLLSVACWLPVELGCMGLPPMLRAALAWTHTLWHLGMAYAAHLAIRIVCP
jgi:hypothetical protein